MVDRTVPVGSFNAVGSAFWRPGQDDVLAPYAERYLELLPSLHEGGMIPAMVLTTGLFPLFGIDEACLDARARGRGRPGARRWSRKTLTERSDEVRRMLQRPRTADPLRWVIRGE